MKFPASIMEQIFEHGIQSLPTITEIALCRGGTKMPGTEMPNGGKIRWTWHEVFVATHIGVFTDDTLIATFTLDSISDIAPGMVLAVDLGHLRIE
jgi:hypothetical protein